MPRLRVNETDLMDRHLLAAMDRNHTYYDITCKHLAETANINKNTLTSRRQRPGEIRLFELRRFVRILHLSPEDILTAIFGGVWKVERAAS